MKNLFENMKVLDSFTVYCSVCGKSFESKTGRDHVCPDCKQLRKDRAKEKAREKRKEDKEKGLGGVAIQVTPAFRDWVKDQAKEKNITMAKFCETLMCL